MHRPIRKLTPEQLAERKAQQLEHIKNSKEIIRKIKESLTEVEPKKCCSNCKHGESRHGGWGCGYEGTWCRLLYTHITIISNSSEAFKAQVVSKNGVCDLYEIDF